MRLRRGLSRLRSELLRLGGRPRHRAGVSGADPEIGSDAAGNV